MERSSFFNAILDQDGNPDRAYLAEDFARYFATFIGNGVFPNPANQLQVVAVNDDMQIRIREGLAWINGYMYENTCDYIFILEPADGVLNRVDRIVLRLDFLERKVKSVLKKGDYASSAVSKNLQRDADAYEIALADIKVKAGAIKITQADVTDLRLNKNLCGIVHGVVDQVDTTAIFNQFQDWYSRTKEAYDKDIAIWTTEKKEAFDNWYRQNTQDFFNKFNKWYEDNTSKWVTEFTTWFKNTEVWETEFTNWFNNIKTVLDGDIAAKLTNDIGELKNKISIINGEGDVKEKANKEDLNSLKSNVNKSLNEKADKVIRDDSTNKKYELGIKNGLLYYREVL